jgi:hypothetical protein
MGTFGGACRILAIVALASCSLTTSLDGYSGGGGATGDDGGTTADGGTTTTDDGGLLGDSALVVDGCDSTGCFDMPPGFSLVAFGASAKGAACPAGFGTPTDTVEGPTFSNGACTCACTTGTAPSCPSGTLTGGYDTDGSGMCGSTTTPIPNPTVCNTTGFLGPFATNNEHSYSPPAATGGTCNASATKDSSKLSYDSQGRVCEATTLPQCGTKVCPPAAAAPFGVCIASDGDVACPSLFPNKHLVGTSASFTCGSGCGCSATASCQGKLEYFDTADCSGGVSFTLTVDGTCRSTATDGGTFGSHKYTAFAPANIGCSKSGSSSPSATLNNTTTVCCN